MAADEPPESIARLLTFCGLDAVLLVRPCGAAERIVSARVLVGSLIAGETTQPPACELPRCRPGDCLFGVTRAMFRCDHDSLLVEEDGRRLALITMENLARYLTQTASARG